MGWNKDKLIDYIPFGFVQDCFLNKNQLLITSKGNIIHILSLPADVYLVKILEKDIRYRNEKIIRYNQHYNIFYSGFTKEFLDSNRFQIIPIKILNIVFQRKKNLIYYETMEPLPEDIIGSLLCVNKNLLDQQDDLYFLHIKDKLVKDKDLNQIGIIKDYIETGAHGVLVIKLTLPEFHQKEIFVPFIDEFCNIVYSHNKEIHYVIIDRWEFFLDT